MMEEKNIFDKRKSSDAVRLEAVKRRKHEKAAQAKHISISLRNWNVGGSQNKKIIFNDDDDNNEKEDNVNAVGAKHVLKEKVTLFDSSSSENEDETEDYNKRFEIKKQFEGKKGQQLFEMSSQFTDERFKLDERFKEDDDDDNNDESLPSASDNEKAVKDDEEQNKAEKKRNLEILQQILGFQLPVKPPLKKWKYVRFDPDSPNASDYIIKNDEKQKDKKKEKKTAKEQPSESNKPVVSKERFYEVASDLKEILNTKDESFSLTKKFGCLEVPDDEPSFSSEHSSRICQVPDLFQKRVNAEKSDTPKTSEETAKPKFKFFIQPNDHRLTEGINFFRRPANFEEIREQWPAKRAELMEIYKKNWRSHIKSKRGRKAFKKRNNFYNNADAL